MGEQVKRAAEVLREYAEMIYESHLNRSGPNKGRCDPPSEEEVAEYRALAAGLESLETAPTMQPPATLCSVELWDDIVEFIKDCSDVVDGNYGEPQPNRAMQLISRIEQGGQ